MDYLSSDIIDYINTYLKKEPHLALSLCITTQKGDQMCFFSSGTPPHAQTLYEIGSITKVYVASLLAKLVHEGKIRLEDPISAFFDLPDHRSYPTILELATHTSGYWPWVSIRFLTAYLLKNRNLTKNYYQNQTVERFHKYLRRKPRFMMNRYHYADFNYAIIGQIIAQVEQKPYDEVMRDFLCNSLGLRDSRIAQDAQPGIESYYRTHVRHHLTWNPNNPYAPAGAILTTPQDSLDFIKKNLRQDPEYLRLALTPTRKIQFQKQSMRIGLAWHMFPDGNYVFHKGGTSCYRATYLLHKKKQIGMTLLANTIGDRTHNTTKLSMMIFKQIKNIMRNQVS
jgi:beta-lactamase class C